MKKLLRGLAEELGRGRRDNLGGGKGDADNGKSRPEGVGDAVND